MYMLSFLNVVESALLSSNANNEHDLKLLCFEGSNVDETIATCNNSNRKIRIIIIKKL